ncbi:MAG: sporulation transcriptional regulator SpoIIID [Ruminococcus sp.]|nr:sporulation transcriptional regulator SpoIIID [Ruminococcus sp.]
MTDEERQRAIALGEYTVEHRTTVRATAKHFGISKSTVHKELTERLPGISPMLGKQVRALLELNKKERHIRGGLATKHKYEQSRRAANQSRTPSKG